MSSVLYHPGFITRYVNLIIYPSSMSTPNIMKSYGNGFSSTLTWKLNVIKTLAGGETNSPSQGILDVCLRHHLNSSSVKFQSSFSVIASARNVWDGPPPYKFLDSASEPLFYALVASLNYQQTYKSFDSRNRKRKTIPRI